MLFYERMSADRVADVSKDSVADLSADGSRADSADDDDGHKFKIDLSPDLAEVSVQIRCFFPVICRGGGRRTFLVTVLISPLCA